MYNLDYINRTFWFISKDKTERLTFPTIKRLRYGIAIASYNDKFIFEGGGYDETKGPDNRESEKTYYDSVSMYNIHNDTWSSVPNM